MQGDVCVCVLYMQRLLGCDKPATRASSRPIKQQSEHLCPVCGGRFTQPTDLAVHLHKIHNIKTEIVDVFSPADGSNDHQLTLTDSLHAVQLYHTHRAEHDVHTSPALSVK